MSGKLDGKIALITGAAAGIAAPSAICSRAEGAKVIATNRGLKATLWI